MRLVHQVQAVRLVLHLVLIQRLGPPPRVEGFARRQVDLAVVLAQPQQVNLKLVALEALVPPPRRPLQALVLRGLAIKQHLQRLEALGPRQLLQHPQQRVGWI